MRNQNPDQMKATARMVRTRDQWPECLEQKKELEAQNKNNQPNQF